MKISKRFNKLKKKSKKKGGIGSQGYNHARRAAQKRREQQTSTSSSSTYAPVRRSYDNSDYEEKKKQEEKAKEELLKNKQSFIEKYDINLLNEIRKEKRIKLVKTKSKELELHNLIKFLIEQFVFSYNYEDIHEIFNYYSDIDFDKLINEMININKNITSDEKEKLEKAYNYFPYIFSNLDYKFDESKKVYNLPINPSFKYEISLSENMFLFNFEIFMKEIFYSKNKIDIEKHIKLINSLLKQDLDILIPDYNDKSKSFFSKTKDIKQYIHPNIDIDINYWTIQNINDINFDIDIKITKILNNQNEDYIKIKEYVSYFKQYDEVYKHTPWFDLIIKILFNKYEKNLEYFIEIIYDDKTLLNFYYQIRYKIKSLIEKHLENQKNILELNEFENINHKILMKLFKIHKDDKKQISYIINYFINFNNMLHHKYQDDYYSILYDEDKLKNILDSNNSSFNYIHLDAILQIFKPSELSYDNLREMINCPDIYNNDYTHFIIDTIKSSVLLSINFNHLTNNKYINMNMFETCFLCDKIEPQFTIKTDLLPSFYRKTYYFPAKLNQKDTLKATYWLLGIPNKWKKYKKKYGFFGSDTENQIFDEKKMNQTINELEPYKRNELFRYIFTNLNINMLNLYEDYHFPYDELIKHKEDFIKLQEYIYENRIYFIDDLNIPIDYNIQSHENFLKYIDTLNEHHQKQNEFIKNKKDYVSEFFHKYPQNPN